MVYVIQNDAIVYGRGCEKLDARLQASQQGAEFITSSATRMKSDLKDIDKLREETRIYHDQVATMLANLTAVFSLSEKDRTKGDGDKTTETVDKKEWLGTGLQYL